MPRGSLIQRTRKDGSTVWCIKYYDGSGRQRWETIGPRKRDAERALTQRLAESESGGDGVAGSQAEVPTFEEYIEVWDAQKARSVRDSTMRSYRGHVNNHLLPYFGRMRLSHITLGVVQRFVDQWRGDPNTLRKVLATLSGIVKSAAVAGLMTSLDFSALTLPRLEVEEPIRVLTIAELNHLISKIDERYAPDLLFLAMTGLRRGEWIALPEEYVDLEGESIWVAQSLDGEGGIGPTKSGRPRRVYLFDKAKDAVLWKRELKQDQHVSSEWAFPNMSSGGLIQPSNWFNRVWRPAINRAGFQDLRLHDLRHTAASLMIRAGAEPHFVANQLGHTDPGFTMRVYAHWFQDQTRATVGRINEAFRDLADDSTGKDAVAPQ